MYWLLVIRKSVKIFTFPKNFEQYVNKNLQKLRFLQKFTTMKYQQFSKNASKRMVDIIWVHQNFEEYPDLLELQKMISRFCGKIYSWSFEDINPIWDIAWEKMYISISDIKVSEPAQDIEECKKKELTYGWVISWKVKLVEKVEDESGKISENILFSKRANIWTLPVITPYASYIVNWVERVIISQIIRSYGIFYNQKDFGFWFRIIPERGSWIETKVEKSGVIVVRINKSRKFPITTLLRVFGLETDESIIASFTKVDEDDTDYIWITLNKDTTTDALSVAEFIYNN